MDKLASERVIVEAPMSFTGSTKRIWRLTEGERAGWLQALVFTGAVLLLLVAWCVIAAWYLIFSIFLIPYRLIRRSSRNRKRTELQHREMLAAVKRDQS